MSKITFCKGHNRLDDKEQVNFVKSEQGKERKKTLNMILYFCFIWIVVLLHKQVSAQECPQEFERLGCHNANVGYNRTVPEFLFANQDLSGALEDLICQCAEQTRTKGYRVFALQKGECYSGKEAETSFPKGGQAFNCRTFQYKPCVQDDKYCTGDEDSIFVYRLLDTHTPAPKPSCLAPKTEHHYDLACKVYNLTVLLSNTTFDDYLWFAHSSQFIELRQEFELGVLQSYDGYDPFLGVTTLRFSQAPGDNNIVVHFVIEFKDKGVHLHNLTAAVACGTLGKLTLIPSLGQVACYKAPPPPVCPLPCFSACAPNCYSSCCQQYHPYYDAPPQPPPRDIHPASCPEGCPITCATFGCTSHCCNSQSLPHYEYGKRHQAPRPEKQSIIGHIFRKYHGKN